MRSGRYQASYVDGAKQRQLAPTTFRTRADAEAWLADVSSSIRAGMWADPTLGKTPLAKFGRDYLDNVVGLRPSTIERDRGYFTRYLVPAFGSTPLARIDRAMVQTWIGELSSRLAPATVQKAGQTLHKIMGEAVAQRYIIENPAANIRYPKAARSKRLVLSPAEIERLTEAMDPQYQALVPFLCFSGLRIGEAFALRVSDVELDKAPARVNVERTVVDLGTLHFHDPKTDAGIRVVPLPDEVAAALREHIARHELGDDDPLFPARRGGITRLNGWRRRYWNPAIEQAKLAGFNVHQTRRTAVTLWLEYGIPLEVAQVWLGHADLRMILDVYAKPRKEAQLALMDRMSAAMAAQSLQEATVVPIR
jgi:integrase